MTRCYQSLGHSRHPFRQVMESNLVRIGPSFAHLMNNYGLLYNK